MTHGPYRLWIVREGAMRDEFGLEVARQFCCASDDEWPAYFEHLRRGKRLSQAITQINALLDEPEHRQVAVDALRRIGLWHEYLGANA
jgi:hypothetical protein